MKVLRLTGAVIITRLGGALGFTTLRMQRQAFAPIFIFLVLAGQKQLLLATLPPMQTVLRTGAILMEGFLGVESRAQAICPVLAIWKFAAPTA